jgi:transcriptional regulator with XRE-family HTH domain
VPVTIADVRDAEAVRRNRELQRRLYGEPLGDRLRRLLGALDVSQTVLAETLRVSSPMLSQLISGRRAKIGSPAVLGRLEMLEQRLVAGRGGEVEPLLAEVRAAEPRSEPPAWSAESHPESRPESHPEPYDVLRRVAGPEELARAADTLDRGFPSLAGLLRRAAGRA